MKGLLAAAVLTLLLAAPGATAATARVELVAGEGIWNGASSVDVAQAGAVELWVPAQGRLHGVTALVGSGEERAVAWAAVAPDRLRVDVPEGASEVRARFDLMDARPTLARYVAPAGVDRLELDVAPPEGRAAQVTGATPVEDAEGATLVVASLSPGDAVTVRVVAADRVGELPLLATLAGIALVALLGGLAWHAIRPPLAGRQPQRFLDHLSELQARLVPPLVVFGLLNLLYFTAGLRAVSVFGLPMAAPTFSAESTLAARAFDAIAERLVPDGVQLVVLRPADAVVAQLGICLFLAFVTTLPLLAYEIAAFLAPALQPRERGLALRTLPLLLGLFLAGAVLAYTVMAPFMIRTLYEYAPTLGAAPLLGVGDLVGFALLVVLTLGLAFELPVVMYALARLGVVGARTFGRYLRHAIVAIVVVAGVVTPDPSVISQLLLAGPLVGLYVVGIAAAGAAERRRAAPA